MILKSLTAKRESCDPEPDRNSFTRTEQYSFVQAGVPALAMKFGWAPGSPEYKAWRSWLAERYHSTDDDLNQPVDLASAAQFNSFLPLSPWPSPTYPVGRTTWNPASFTDLRMAAEERAAASFKIHCNRRDCNQGLIAITGCSQPRIIRFHFLA